MAKPPGRNSPAPARSSPAEVKVQQLTQRFEGPIPHPALLQQYNEIVPGAAERILQMAEAETDHRQALERQAHAANIAAQERQVAIAAQQSADVFRSDTLGQQLGFLVSCLSLGGSIYLAASGQPWVAGLLAGLPLASVIRALRDRSAPGKPPPPA